VLLRIEDRLHACDEWPVAAATQRQGGSRRAETLRQEPQPRFLELIDKLTLAKHQPLGITMRRAGNIHVRGLVYSVPGELLSNATKMPRLGPVVWDSPPNTTALVSDQAGPPILYDLSRFKSERSGRSVVGQSLARLSILYLARRNIDNEFGELGGVAWGAYEGCSGEQLGPRHLAQWALPVMQAGVFFDPAIAACSFECEVSA
jgi:hypothetical protein